MRYTSNLTENDVISIVKDLLESEYLKPGVVFRSDSPPLCSTCGSALYRGRKGDIVVHNSLHECVNVLAARIKDLAARIKEFENG